MTKRSSLARIDDNVYISMGAILLVSMIVFAFRFATHKDCFPVDIKRINPSDIDYVGQNISFKAESPGGSSFEWDFGDSTVLTTQVPSTTHTYKSFGKYTVSVTVNDRCIGFYDVYVKALSSIPESSPDVSFIGPSEAYVNAPVTFKDTSSVHTLWQWYADENQNVGGHLKEFTTTYDQAGFKKVMLKVKVNNKEEVGYKYITIKEDPKKIEKESGARRNQGKDIKIVEVNTMPVNPPLTNSVPEQKQPETKKDEPIVPQYPAITHDGMGRMIKGYIDGTVLASDFSKFGCDNGNITVQYKNETMRLQEFLGKIKGIKSKKIEGVNADLSKDPTSQCVRSMNVTIKESKNIFQKILH